MENQSKPFYVSLSFWGTVGMVVALFGPKIGVQIDAQEFATAAAATATAMTGAVSAVVALIGIFRRKDIHVVAPPQPQ